MLSFLPKALRHLRPKWQAWVSNKAKKRKWTKTALHQNDNEGLLFFLKEQRKAKPTGSTTPPPSAASPPKEGNMPAFV